MPDRAAAPGGFDQEGDCDDTRDETEAVAERVGKFFVCRVAIHSAVDYFGVFQPTASRACGFIGKTGGELWGP